METLGHFIFVIYTDKKLESNSHCVLESQVFKMNYIAKKSYLSANSFIVYLTVKTHPIYLGKAFVLV